jgi:hypothetical protein
VPAFQALLYETGQCQIHVVAASSMRSPIATRSSELAVLLADGIRLKSVVPPPISPAPGRRPKLPAPAIAPLSIHA